MNETLMRELEMQQIKMDRLLGTSLVLSSVIGRLEGVIKVHSSEQLVGFCDDLLEVIRYELKEIEERYQSKI